MSTIIVKSSKFALGQLVVTAGVNEEMAENSEFSGHVLNCMRRHAAGDWGDLCREDVRENEESLKQGFRLLSSYDHGVLPKIWIITEADRSVTTVLFPEEY